MTKRLYLLVFSLLVFVKNTEACSPLPTPSVISIVQTGTNIVFNLQSQSIYNCSYSVQVELACMGGTMSGNAPFYFTSAAFQASVNPIAIPQFTMPLTGLCLGGVYQYRFRQNSNGAFSPWSVVYTFTMPGIPVPTTMTVTANPTLICFPQTSQLQASVSGGCGGGGGATYSWTPATGLSCTNCANPVANPTANTIYSVCAYGNGQANCWSVCGTVSVVSPPSGLALTASNKTICIGAVTTITASGSPTYTWNTGSNSSSIVVAPLTNTTYVVSGGVVPCLGSVTVNIVVQPIPSLPTVTPNNFVACSLSGSIITALSNVPNFVWYNNGTVMATPQNTLAVPNATGAYSWFVAAMSNSNLVGSCKSNTVPVNFTISPTPTLIVSNQTICAGASTTLTASGGLTYTWSTGANTNTIVVAPLTNTFYTVASGVAPCNGQVTVNVVTQPQPNAPTVTPNNFVACSLSGSVLTAVSNVTNFAWYSGLGGPLIATTPTLAVPNGTGTYQWYVAAAAGPVTSGSLTMIATGSPTTFAVPPGVTQITVDLYGAEGGDAVGTTTGWGAGPVNLSGGNGGRVQAVITTTPGEILNIYLGTKGTMTAGVGSWNGGGFISSCPGGIEVISAGGGGASDIRRLGVGIPNRILVAGGGGGASGAGNSYLSPTNSGAGGGLIGASATNIGGVVCVNGLGGSQVAGGTGGNVTCWCGGASVAGTGSLGLGGVSICAPSGLSTCGCNGTGCTNGGGGGGGYWGGGAGIAFAGGGGGSNYVLPSAISSIHSQGVSTGNGSVTIIWQGAAACMSSLVPVNFTITPTPTLVVSNQTVCAGVNTTITATGGLTYTWSTGANTSSIVVAPNTNTFYTVASGTAPCNGQVTVNIIVATPNAPTVTPNNTSFCINTFTAFTAVSNSTAFSWYNVPGGPIIASTNTLAMPGGSGTVTYYVSASQTLSSSGSLTFNATGATTNFAVPPGVTQITVDVWGAEGGDAVGTTTGWGAGAVNLSGGDGGRVQAVITTTPGEILNLNVGTRGTMTAGVGSWNGGGFISSCPGGIEVISAGGGGASDIRRAGVGIPNRIVVAGGGGGASGAGNSYLSPTNSGAGGGLTGLSATNIGGVVCVNGLGGSQVAGGTGGNNSCWCGLANVAGTGSLGLGGVSICAPSGLSTCGCSGTGCTNGGGGGGGYWGGGAGICFAGGGGGSNYILPGAISVTHSQGVRTGNGLITIAWAGAGVCTSSLTPVTVTILPCVLPLELINFDAVRENMDVKLNWTTKTEKNTDKFIIERSHDMRNWTEICTVKAAGNSSIEKNYDCIDTKPLQGISYYRLKTIDIDKSFSYSDVRMVEYDRKGIIVIHPNPAHDKLYVQFVGNVSVAGIEIADARGAILITDSQVKVGNEKDNVVIDISKLSSGVYFVVVTENGIRQAKKFIVE